MQVPDPFPLWRLTDGEVLLHHKGDCPEWNHVCWHHDGDLVDGSTYPGSSCPRQRAYTVIIGYGSDREEVCTVTAKTGTNQFTVTRGQDGTAAISKNSGDIVVHGVSAQDFTSVANSVPVAIASAITVSTSAASGTPTSGQVLWVRV